MSIYYNRKLCIYLSMLVSDGIKKICLKAFKNQLNTNEVNILLDK